MRKASPIGKTWGTRRVVEEASSPRAPGSRVRWVVHCKVCCRRSTVVSSELTKAIKGNRRCACQMRQPKTGSRNGLLVVQSDEKHDLLVRCDCGREMRVNREYFRTRKSCGNHGAGRGHQWMIDVHGVRMSLSELSRAFGINRQTIKARLRVGANPITGKRPP